MKLECRCGSTQRESSHNIAWQSGDVPLIRSNNLIITTIPKVIPNYRPYSFKSNYIPYIIIILVLSCFLLTKKSIPQKFSAQSFFFLGQVAKRDMNYEVLCIAVGSPGGRMTSFDFIVVGLMTLTIQVGFRKGKRANMILVGSFWWKIWWTFSEVVGII